VTIDVAALHAAELGGASEDPTRIDVTMLEAIAEHARVVDLEAGTVLFQEGDAVHCAYIVVYGRLQLSRGQPPERQWVGDCTAATMLGEVGVLARSTRTATAVAARRSRLLELDAETLERLMSELPAFGVLVARRAARVAVFATKGNVAAPPITLLVGDGCQQALADALHDVDATLVVVGEREIGDGDVEDHIVNRLGADGRGGPVFVVAAPHSLALASRVDRVVVVQHASYGVDDRVAALVHARVRGALAVRVVALHDQRVRGTAALVESYGTTDVVNVLAGERRDVHRLHRVLTDQSRALVLGAGGARAFAQIGALRAFEEAQIEFDFVVGAGFGALIGAQYALGWSAADIAARNRSAWLLRGRIPTLPSIAAFSGAPVARVMRQWFGDLDIADTRARFRPCTADLSTNTSTAVASGSLATWVRAAAAIPGVYPPHVSGGHIFVDGSVVDALPAGHARAAGATEVYAVDTRPLRRHTVDAQQTDAPQGVSWIVQSIPIVGSGFPSLVALIEQSLASSQAAHQAESRQLCDVVVEPPVDRYGALDFGALGALDEIGYLETARRITEHRDA
jgi:NTE family protein